MEEQPDDDTGNGPYLCQNIIRSTLPILPVLMIAIDYSESRKFVKPPDAAPYGPAEKYAINLDPDGKATSGILDRIFELLFLYRPPNHATATLSPEPDSREIKQFSRARRKYRKCGRTTIQITNTICRFTARNGNPR